MRRAEVDLAFLVRSRDNNVAARFLNFRLNLLSYLCAMSIKFTNREFNHLCSSLQQQMNSIDYAHICSAFLKSNNPKFKSNSKVQQKKFYNLLKKNVLLKTQIKSSLIYLIISYLIAKIHLLLKIQTK